jgi:hypothetical protein
MGKGIKDGTEVESVTRSVIYTCCQTERCDIGLNEYQDLKKQLEAAKLRVAGLETMIDIAMSILASVSEKSMAPGSLENAAELPEY